MQEPTKGNHADWLRSPERNRRKGEESRQRIASSDNRILILVIKGEWNQQADERRKRTPAQPDIHSSRYQGKGYGSERSIGQVQTNQYPEQKVPERRTAFVAHLMEDSANTQVARDEPGLRLIRPRLVEPDSHGCDCRKQQQYQALRKRQPNEPAVQQPHLQLEILFHQLHEGVPGIQFECTQFAKPKLAHPEFASETPRSANRICA